MPGLCGAGDQIRSHVRARQVLYPRAISPVTFIPPHMYTCSYRRMWSIFSALCSEQALSLNPEVATSATLAGQHTPFTICLCGVPQGWGHRFMLGGLTFMWVQRSGLGLSHTAQQMLYTLRQFPSTIFRRAVTRTVKMMCLDCMLFLLRPASPRAHHCALDGGPQGKLKEEMLASLFIIWFCQSQAREKNFRRCSGLKLSAHDVPKPVLPSFTESLWCGNGNLLRTMQQLPLPGAGPLRSTAR